MTDLAHLIAAVPLGIRVAVGLIGAILLVAGARWYFWGLALAAFATGAALVASGLVYAATWLPVLTDPAMVVGGALVGGVSLVWLTRVAHQMAMVGAGALTGLVVGAALIQWLFAPAWVALITGLVGALTFPWVYRQLLKVLTPAVGAACLAWAVGMPDNPLLLGGLWAFGSAVQVFGGGKKSEPVEDESE